MSDNYEKVDRAELIQHQENLAIQEYDVLVNRCALQPVSFLRENYSFKKMRDRRSEPNITTTLTVTWIKIGMLCGLKENQNQEVAQDVTNLIFNYHAELTLEEIFKAFELERFGIYPEKTEHYQFFNSEYVSAILKKYKVWKRETKIQHNISPKKEDNLLPSLTQSQIKETMNEGIINRFNHYKEHKEIEHPFAHVFDDLLERGIIKKATKDTPKLFYYYQDKLKQAEEQVKKEFEVQRHSASINKSEFREELEKIAKKQSDAAQVRAKKLVLIDFFEKHIKENTDFESFIKNHK